MRSGRLVLGFLLWSAIAAGQQYVISTIAGGAPVPTPTPGLRMWNSVFRLDPSGIVTRVAGTSRVGSQGMADLPLTHNSQTRTGWRWTARATCFIADSGTVASAGF